MTYFTYVKGDWHAVRVSGPEKGFVTLEKQTQKAHRTSHGSRHRFCVLKWQVEPLLSDGTDCLEVREPGMKIT